MNNISTGCPDLEMILGCTPRKNAAAKKTVPAAEASPLESEPTGSADPAQPGEDSPETQEALVGPGSDVAGDATPEWDNTGKPEPENVSRGAAESPADNDTLKAALDYIARGWSVIPCAPRGKKPLIKWQGWQNQRATATQVRDWFQRWPDANLAVVTGAISGLVVLDLDGPEAVESLRDKALPPTLIARTGKGEHRYFRHPGGHVASRAGILHRVDIRSDGGFVVAPPSLHASGARYEWALYEPISDAPTWLLELVKPEAGPGTVELSDHDQTPPEAGTQESRRDLQPAKVEPVLEGCAWLKHCKDDAAQLRESEWYAMLSIVGRCENGSQHAHEWSNPYPTYTPAETDEKLRHALTAAGPRTCADIRRNGGESYCAQCPNAGRVRSPIVLGARHNKLLQLAGNLRRTDTGNARALVIAHGEDIRHVRQWGWLAWNGTRWERNAEKEVQRRAKQAADRLLDEIKDEPDSTQRELMAKWAAKSLDQARLTAMVKNAESESTIDASTEDFDRDPWLFNCPNGTIDLRTGQLEQHFREDLITKLAPVDFDPAATCPQWEAFLDKIFAGNRNLIKFVQRAIGYSLTGQQAERAFFILCGSGRNGKTTLLETLRAVLGDYAGQIPIESLMTQKNSGRPGATPEFVELKGKRFVTSSETEEGQRLAESAIKKLTGANTIKARDLYEKFIEFAPTHHIFMDCNHRPEIRGTDPAIWDRIRLVPFAVRISDEEVDANLGEKLTAEAPGILRWAVEGCLAWQCENLGFPSEVKEAMEEYRRESDILAQFLQERTTPEIGYRLRARDLFVEFRRYCQLNNLEVPSSNRFYRQMKRSEIDRWTHPHSRDVFYVGIKFRQDPRMEEDAFDRSAGPPAEGERLR